MVKNQSQILSKDDIEYEAPTDIVNSAKIKLSDYEKNYQRSIEDAENFWSEIAMQELDWFDKWDKVREWNYPNYKWFLEAKLNITHNCLDRHVNSESEIKLLSFTLTKMMRK